MILQGLPRCLLAVFAVWGVALRAGERGPDGPLANELAAIEKAPNIAAALARLDRLTANLPPQERMIAWKHEAKRMRVARAWRVGTTVCFAASRSMFLQALDALTGQPTRLRLRASATSVWVRPVAGGKQALVATPRRIQVVDPRTGVVSRSVECKLTVRIAPVPFQDGFVVVPVNRGRRIARVGPKGETMWECTLPGYVRVHPAAFGPLLVVQTRGGSYGGQATSGVDLRTGERLWSDTVNAYGCGAAFADDAQFVVESDLWMSPQATEGRLICREPKSGRKRWEYRRAGMIHDCPLVEPGKGRVCALFSTGAVVCLAGGTGDVLWTTRLPETSRPSRGGSYYPYWPTMAIHGARLMVVDRENAVHLLDLDTGKRLASCVPVSPVTPDGKDSSGDDLVTMPWIEGENLIVASTRRIAAYPAARMLAGEEPLELRARAARVRLLLRLGNVDEAARELARIQDARPASALAWECAAMVRRARNDVEGEVVARLWLMRRRGLQADKRLFRLTGLVRRIPCGPQPTRPLLAEGKLFVGARDGMLRAWDADTLEPAGELDVQAGLSRSLTAYQRAIVFPTENRRVRGVSYDLKPVFDWPSANTHALYLVVGDRLVRSSGYASYVKVGALDPKTGRFGAEQQLRGVRNKPILHRGRAYYATAAGGATSFDGEAVQGHRGLYPVNLSGDRPVAYSAGGVHDIDERLRPTKLLVRAPGRIITAARNRGAIAVLYEQRDRAATWILEAWTEGGQKLPVRYTTPRYAPTLAVGPPLVAFGPGFLLVGRALVYVNPREKDPVWRFWPGGRANSGFPDFRGPVLRGDNALFTHRSGAVFVFKWSRIIAPVKEL